MNISKFEKINIAFWIIYILIPIFTGWMVYQTLPNEYNEERHELLESHLEECGSEGMQSCDVPDKWRDKITGEIYIPSQFSSHHRAEAKRIAIIAFVYGLIGCLFYAYGRVVEHRIFLIDIMKIRSKEDIQQELYKKFFKSLKYALFVDFVFALLFWGIA